MHWAALKIDFEASSLTTNHLSRKAEEAWLALTKDQLPSTTGGISGALEAANMGKGHPPTKSPGSAVATCSTIHSSFKPPYP